METESAPVEDMDGWSRKRERTRQYIPATTVEGTREALVQEISECGYVVSQIFLSLISSWR